MFKKSVLYIPICLIILLHFSCTESKYMVDIETKLNPNGIAPLTAMLYIKSEKACMASINIKGESSLEQSFTQKNKSLEIPIVGLYPNTNNEVELTLTYDDGIHNEIIKIQTEAIPEDFPTIEINKLDESKMEKGFHACDFHLANHGKFKTSPFIFDNQGIIRWYLDLSFIGNMVAPFQRIKNGNILMAGRHSIYEYDMLGKQISKTDIDNNYGMHHDLVELPDGNLLIPVGKRDSRMLLNGETIWSDSDWFILFDRKTKKITREWDLATHLDVSRHDINKLRKEDWLHMNALLYDQKDKSIIVSGKHQGLIKLGWNNKLQWIMSPHKNWNKAGRTGEGKETKPFLLTAVNEQGEAFSKDIQMGLESPVNFDFPWSQHVPKYLPNGHIITFDNGSHRNFKDETGYSRAVEYKVDEKNKTVQQIWEYGKDRKTEFYSAIISDVDYLNETGNILITSGYLNPKSTASAKIVEVDYKTKEEIFEATLYYKTLNGNKTFAWGQADIIYRSERLNLDF